MKNLIAAVLLLISLSTQAAIVRIDFTAEITIATGELSNAHGTISGTALYKTDGQDSNSSSWTGEYFQTNKPLGLTANINGADDLNLQDMFVQVGYGVNIEYVNFVAGELDNPQGRTTGQLHFRNDAGTSLDDDSIPTAAELGTMNPVIFSYVKRSPDEVGRIEADLISANISVVPIPASVWLFGSALAGLGWMRRKQTV
jgi:hypothetical protein